MLALMTDLLDALGLLLVAAGVTLGLWAFIGPWALIVGGVIVIAGSQYAAWPADHGKADKS